MFTPIDGDTVTTITHFIQLSVAPVFLLAGVAGLLNVFTGRLTRIIDKLERLDSFLLSQEKKDKEYKEDKELTRRRMFLVMRMRNTNYAIFFGTATGLMVALVILTIFSSTLLSFQSDIYIAIFFILGMLFLILALCLFLREIYFTTSFIKVKRDKFKNRIKSKG